MPERKKNPDRGTAGGARRSLTFEELAKRQGIRPEEQLERIVGGFSEEEFEGFDEALERWRGQGA